MIASLVLILFVLLHAGRGGGLSGMFSGGGVDGGLGGSTVTERNLDRLTVAVAIVFAITTVLLVMRLD